MNELKILHLNIRSLRNTEHLIELRELATSTKIDILTISETWLNSSITNAEINIADYKVYTDLIAYTTEREAVFVLISGKTLKSRF